MPCEILTATCGNWPFRRGQRIRWPAGIAITCKKQVFRTFGTMSVIRVGTLDHS